MYCSIIHIIKGTQIFQKPTGSQNSRCQTGDMKPEGLLERRTQYNNNTLFMPTAGGSTVVCIFGRCPQNVGGTSRCRGVSESCRGCNGGYLWSASGFGSMMPIVRRPGARIPRYVLVAWLCCRASRGDARCIGQWCDIANSVRKVGS
jgi:hypothetical protein